MKHTNQKMTSNSNNQLKDFQLATVDYVFNRFIDTVNPCNRFLVADEVGLGKTLIARGVIQKFYEYFKSKERSSFNVIYICSNQSIASQNINRLNIEKQKGVSQTQINRINDLAITNTNQNEATFFNIVALSPNTSFNISSGGGLAKERSILYHILSKNIFFNTYREKLKKILRLDVSEVNWETWVSKDCWVKKILREDISNKFNAALDSKNINYKALLSACEERYSENELQTYRRVVGGLRKLLASVCVEYLKPDLIVMDEFQRFKYLIDLDEDNEVKLITESLFSNEKIKILLLSATPYKMYTMQSEDEQGESHFDEFKFIVDFLLNDENKKQKFLEAWDDYSKALLHIGDGNWNFIKEQKEIVEKALKSIIARTERITVSDDGNTLLRSSKSNILWITPADIQNFVSADAVASKLKDVNSPIEYCKSSPFPFSFMEGYQLQKITQKEIASGNKDIQLSLKKSKHSFLPIEQMNNYSEINSPNAKLSYLLNDSLYNGGSDLLWIPPSLPYYGFEGAYLGKENYSKTLVFSSWVMIPKMIAALSSYECERLTIGHTKAIENAEERSDRKYFQTGSERHPKARLRFRIENSNFSTLSQYAILYPCLTLSGLWNPLKSDSNQVKEILFELTNKIQNLISQIPATSYITEPSKKEDDRWALIYMLLLDRKFNKDKVNLLVETENSFDWDWFNKAEEKTIANEYFEKVFGDILFCDYYDKNLLQILRDLKLGQPPLDICMQLAYLTIASPAVCSYRLLNGFTSINKQSDYISFYGAFRIADSFRKFYNVAENISVIDKHSKFDSYWKNILLYAASGNFQSMLDEFANAMIDHNGLWDYSLEDKINKLVELVADNIGLRTVSVAAHTYESFIKESKPRHFRCHFGVALSQSMENEKDVMRSDSVRDSFNSPFRPFILSTTSIGQEGLDFHLYCRKILHWNLPANPVDFEQREGRINRFKNLAIRQNLAIKYKHLMRDETSATVWSKLYQVAVEIEKGSKSDLVPYWHVEPENVFIERQVPTIPYSKEVQKLKNLLKTISVYRVALGQPRQEELVNHLIENFSDIDIKKVQNELLINLSPYKRKLIEDNVIDVI